MSENIPGPWIIEKRVLPQHTDHAGVMWHGSYISWLEEARIKILSSVGIEYHELSANGFEITVVSLKLDYKNPLRHGDKVYLENFPVKLNGVRWLWKTNFLGDDRKLFAASKVELVVVKKMENGFRIARQNPGFLEEAIDKINSGCFN